MSYRDDDDRYASAAGWDGSDPKQRAELEKAKARWRKEHARELYDGSALAIESAKEVLDQAAETDPPRQLFGNLFREGEMAILFSDTGLGKSVLAVQIAESIALGRNAFKDSPPNSGGVAAGRGGVPEPIKPVVPPTEPSSLISRASSLPLNTCPPLPVLYLDFELTQAQFSGRYSEDTKDGEYINPHTFPDETHWNRGRIDWDGELPEGFKDFGEVIINSIAKAVDRYPARVLIIDNITYLCPATASARRARSLMQNLHAFKEYDGLSILVIAHTPKLRVGQPITLNDLQGSKMLSNFADSVFAIGRDARAPDVRYIKELKSRMAAERYGAGNVITCRLEKPANFLKFTFESFSHEQEHIWVPKWRRSGTDLGDDAPGDLLLNPARLKSIIRNLARRGLSHRRIARRLAIGEKQVRLLSATDPTIRGVKPFVPFV